MTRIRVTRWTDRAHYFWHRLRGHRLEPVRLVSGSATGFYVCHTCATVKR